MVYASDRPPTPCNNWQRICRLIYWIELDRLTPCPRTFHPPLADTTDLPFDQIHHWSDSDSLRDLSIRSLALFRIDRDLESRIRLERRIRLS